ncbi:MAG: glycerol-3-phosphate 1-O-acyltransferase PlsY [Oscillospiraceae bacterium]|nr:glycerol-3-phosphate 1-O-acyltransferase PlsY [Oscillospiraceae bacterium]
MEILLLLAIAAGSYLLGGLNGAIITSRLVYRDDIRNHGSGNAGLTNFYRTYGSHAIFLLILIDVLKTAVPVIVSGMLVSDTFTFASVEERVLVGRTFGGLFAMVGHAYPCLYKFKGGKGVLAGGTAVLFMDIRVGLIVWGVFFVAVVLTKYVSLGSILAGIALPFTFLLFGSNPWAVVLSALYGLLLIYRHRENIVRLFCGEERKLSFGKQRKAALEQEQQAKANEEEQTK